jgi:hypothetical protein
LLSALANALRLCVVTNSTILSFVDLHRSNKIVAPTQMPTYKHAPLLLKLFKSNEQSDDWMTLNLNQILMRRQKTSKILQRAILK